MSLSLALTLMGCTGTLRGYEKKLTKELGIRVEILTDEIDECAWTQAKRLWDEYQYLSEADRIEFKRALQGAYTGLTLNRTEISQTVRGDVYELRHMDASFLCRDPLNQRDCEIFERGIHVSRVLRDDRTVTGPDPETRVMRERVLTLTPQRTDSFSRREIYKTYRKRDYDSIDTLERVRAFMRWPNQTMLIQTDVELGVGAPCSATVGLHELI